MAIPPHGVCCYALIAKDDEALDDVVQLADITSPWAVREYVYGVVIYALDLYGVTRAYLGDEVVDKESNITLPLA